MMRQLDTYKFLVPKEIKKSFIVLELEALCCRHKQLRLIVLLYIYNCLIIFWALYIHEILIR